MRYAIQNAKGAFFTECEIVGTKETIEIDGLGGKTVHDRHLLRPKFEAGLPRAAAKFDTQADAELVMNAPGLEDAAAFADCKAVPVEA
jgi:hypothetical protein